MHFACALPTGKPENFSAYPLLNVHRTELADSLPQTAVSHAQTARDRKSDLWLFFHNLDKNGVWQTQNGRSIQRDNTGLVPLSDQCGLFTKVITGTVLRKGNLPALGRIDHRPHQTGNDEQICKKSGISARCSMATRIPGVAGSEFPSADVGNFIYNTSLKKQLVKLMHRISTGSAGVIVEARLSIGR